MSGTKGTEQALILNKAERLIRIYSTHLIVIHQYYVVSEEYIIYNNMLGGCNGYALGMR